MNIDALLALTQASALAQWIDSSRYYSISFQSIHILAFTMTLAIVLLFNIRLNGLGMAGIGVREFTSSIRPWYRGALLCSLAAGVLIFLPRSVAYAANPVFLGKLVLLIVVIVAQWLLFVRLTRGSDTEFPGLALRLAFALVLLLWFAVGAYGRAVGLV